MTTQSEILKASIPVVDRISKLKASKYKNSQTLGIELERYYDDVMAIAVEADKDLMLSGITDNLKGKLLSNRDDDVTFLIQLACKLARRGGTEAETVKYIFDNILLEHKLNIT